MSKLSQGFPKLAAPLINLKDGNITQPWLQFFISLWGRTGSNENAVVTGVSVATANGFSGSSGGGITPEITLSTTVTGILKGNGTAVSAAISGVDYQPAGNYITALTGDGTAAGPGSAVFTLANSGVSAGSFTNPTISVDSKGRITSASSNAGIAASITTARLTPAGSQGSMTFVNGILTAQTQAT